MTKQFEKKSNEETIISQEGEECQDWAEVCQELRIDVGVSEEEVESSFSSKTEKVEDRREDEKKFPKFIQGKRRSERRNTRKKQISSETDETSADESEETSREERYEKKRKEKIVHSSSGQSTRKNPEMKRRRILSMSESSVKQEIDTRGHDSDRENNESDGSESDSRGDDSSESDTESTGTSDTSSDESDKESDGQSESDSSEESDTESTDTTDKHKVGRSIYYCSECTFTAASAGKVYTHKVDTHKMEKLVCNFCKFTTKNSTSMYNHNKMYCPKNKRMKQFTCSYCKFSTENKTSMYNHKTRYCRRLKKKSK